MISVNQVNKIFNNKVVLRDISFEVAQGECVALIGANGAGKTTLMNCLLGEATDSGQIIINQYAPTQQQLKYILGVLIQDNMITSKLKVRELINFYRQIYPEALSMKAIEQLLLFKPEQYQQFVSQLSGGQRRLLSFVLVLIGQPKILLLDEPTAAMDTDTRLHFWEIIKHLKQQGVTIIYSSHYIEEIEYTADRILFLKEGELVHNSTVYSLRNEQIVKNVTIPLKFKHVIQDVEHIQLHSDHISFTTTCLGEIYPLLVEAGCTIDDIEISHQSLLNTLFNQKEHEYESI